MERRRSRRWQILLMMAAFKAHAALNFWRGQEIGDGSPKAGAMGQFGKLASVVDSPDDATFARLVREAAALASTAPAPREPKYPPKLPPELHPGFAAALAANPAAKATLEGFTASARRVYIYWSTEAKQDSTRTRRIATAIDWLTEGKKRHWKYQNC